MIFFAISVLAGVFTVLAPCILPLLPVVIGASEEGEKGVSKRALTVIMALSVSVIVFTLLLKASTLLIDIPSTFWSGFSGVVLILVGIAIVSPTLWSRVPFVNKLSLISNKAVGSGYQKKSYKGDLLIGFALGPVFTTCSPTYLFIIATVLPATFVTGVVYLLGFTIGLATSLLLIAYFGQRIVNKVTNNIQTAGAVKKIFGVLIILVGLAVFTGYDKKIETAILDSGYGATIELENGLIERFAPKDITTTESELRSNEGELENGLIETLESNEASVTEPEQGSAGSELENGLIEPSAPKKVSVTESRNKGEYETITLAGGCFWCTEAYLQEATGVIEAVSGYAGGVESSANYVAVSGGKTGHREAVRVTFDPTIISTKEILDIYWSHIDPTDTDGQFADTGYQYTTAVFYHDNEQQQIAIDSKKRLETSGLFDKPIATEILPIGTFFAAEEYHQDYYKKAASHYERYKKGSGRAGFVEETWAKDAALQFLRSN